LIVTSCDEVLSSSELNDVSSELFVVSRLCKGTRYTTQDFLILISYWVSFPESDALEQRFEHHAGVAKIRRFLLPCPMQLLTAGTSDK
jgi:hypothetical protein